jgi:hypothetical protein
MAAVAQTRCTEEQDNKTSELRAKKGFRVGVGVTGTTNVIDAEFLYASMTSPFRAFHASIKVL